MSAKPGKVIRCAIYTRKSTEHGLDQEFNSLDAQREACEAYVKSQASEGWKALPQEYDDPAYSGGNLERPALKRLLRDIEAGRIDVIVVYKIDRLTRSLADFAKLVEAFDAKSISFVAVTQQFNTTTSMGRLTLNVLLSFAQFERELASERVRDKVAASRKKGKWTGGTVPLGYDAKDKKLVINKTEAETVRTIFRLYLELKSITKLIGELDRRKIITKRRNAKIAKYQGGIPFTSGPLGYFLNNRIYLGEVHHGGKWFKGEHTAILDRQTFDLAQGVLKSGAVKRRIRRSESGALLMGKLFDDKGNHMSPTFSAKKGIRYRFYASRALVGQKHKAGSVPRISAAEIEEIVASTVRQRLNDFDLAIEQPIEKVEHVVLSKTGALIKLIDGSLRAGKSEEPIRVTRDWSKKHDTQVITDPSSREPDQTLQKAVVRAHVWLDDLSQGSQSSIEDLAAVVKLHPKVIRQGLRLAFLAPALTQAALDGHAAMMLNRIPKLLPLSWSEQKNLLG